MRPDPCGVPVVPSVANMTHTCHLLLLFEIVPTG